LKIHKIKNLTIFTKDGRDNKNIRNRVTQARKIIGALNWGIVAKGYNKKPEKDDL